MEREGAASRLCTHPAMPNRVALPAVQRSRKAPGASVTIALPMVSANPFRALQGRAKKLTLGENLPITALSARGSTLIYGTTMDGSSRRAQSMCPETDDTDQPRLTRAAKGV